MSSCEQWKEKAQARGYIGQLEWLEKMSRQYTQHKCNKCDLYHIWKKKQPIKSHERKERQ